MATIKQTNQKLNIKGNIFQVAPHKVFGEWDNMLTTLSFTNLVCSLPCWLKDCKNGQESESEETLMSGSRNDLLQSWWDLVTNHVSYDFGLLLSWETSC